MNRFHQLVSAGFFALILTCSATSHASVLLWNESINGTFSTDNVSPTYVGTLSGGDNDVIGSLDNTADDFYFVVPAETELTGIDLTAETVVGTPAPNFYLVAGDTFSSSNVVGALNWQSAGVSVGDNLLDLLLYQNGYNGPPIAAGTYEVAFAGYTYDISSFTLDFVDASTVPEPATGVLAGLCLAGVAVFRRRFA